MPTQRKRRSPSPETEDSRATTPEMEQLMEDQDETLMMAPKRKRVKKTTSMYTTIMEPMARTEYNDVSLLDQELSRPAKSLLGENIHTTLIPLKRCIDCIRQYLKKRPRYDLYCEIRSEDDAPRCSRHDNLRFGSESERRAGICNSDNVLEETHEEERARDEQLYNTYEELGGTAQEASETQQLDKDKEGYVSRLEVQQAIRKVINEVFPRTTNDIEAWFQHRQLDSITNHKDFQRLCLNMLNGNKIRVMGLSWGELRDSIPDNHFNDSSYLSIEESVDWFHKIMEHNSISPREFVERVQSIVDKEYPKINTLLLLGPPNAGKTLIANSIVRSCIYYISPQSFEGTKGFEFEAFLNARIALVNEPRITDKTIETMKNIFEGQPVNIDIKYKPSQEGSRCPCICTSNQNLCFYTTARTVNHQALVARCFTFDFANMPQLVECKGQLNPSMWKTLCASFDLD